MLPLVTFFESTSDVRRGVIQGKTTETVHLEFKKDLDRWRAPPEAERRKGQMEFCRDVAQFANTLGGSILIGIEEESIDGVKVAKSIQPLDDFDGRRQWMEQAVANYLIPSTVPFRIVKIEMEQGMIIAVNVPASERLVSLWDRGAHTIEYLRRTNHGKEWMNPDEAEAHLMDTGRRARLAVLRVLKEVPSQEADIASDAWILTDPAFPLDPRKKVWRRLSLSRQERVFVASPGEYEFELRLPGSSINVPYGLVRAVWKTAQNKIGLFLDVRIRLAGPEARLEPTTRESP